MPIQSAAALDIVIIGEKDSNCQTAGGKYVYNMGLRSNGTLEQTDKTIQGESFPIPTGKNLKASAVSYQIPLSDLFGLIKLAAQGFVDAHLVTVPQDFSQNGTPIRDVFNFGYFPDESGYAGIDLDFEISKERKITIDLEVYLALQDYGRWLRANKVNTSQAVRNRDFTKLYQPYKHYVESPGSNALYDPMSISSRKLNLKTKGDKNELTNRSKNNYLSANLELTSDSASMDKMINQLERDPLSSLYFYEYLSPTVRELYLFNGSVSRVDSHFIDKDKRYMKSTFQGDIPIYSATYDEQTANSITTKTLTL